VQKQGQLSLKPNDVKRQEFLGHDRPMAFALGQEEIRKSAIETYSTNGGTVPSFGAFLSGRTARKGQSSCQGRYYKTTCKITGCISWSRILPVRE